MNNNSLRSGLEEKIEEYFGICDGVNLSNEKKIIKPYTMSGLLCHLGITKQEFDELLRKKQYAKVLRRASGRIEAYIEEKSLTGELSINASQGSLKYYFGWGAKEEVQTSGEGAVIKVLLSDETKRLAQ